MTTPLIAGLAIAAAAAYAGRYGIQAWRAFKARPPTARLRKFYEGGFQPKMTRREAALILGVRESTQASDGSKPGVANHPDAAENEHETPPKTKKSPLDKPFKFVPPLIINHVSFWALAL